MCAITGYWNLGSSEALDLLNLETFTDSLAHRGPDGRGSIVLNEGALYLGHRRLSILDLTESGQQPMTTSNERYTIVFNGEIYNFIEIRSELESRGIRFKGSSDTEVLLYAFQVWGKECVYRFNGMWAFAIWDAYQKRLHLCRDRFGVKPLHYWFNGSVFAFASELKAFLALKDFPLLFDRGVVGRSIAGPNFVEGTRESLFENVFKLPPGHWAELRSNFPQLRLSRWWNSAEQTHKESYRLTDQEAEEQYHDLFRDACKLRMRSDVPIGAALSGGLDSSAIYATINQLGQNRSREERMAEKWQSAFVATYPGTLQDEGSYAKQVTDQFNGDLNEIEMNPTTCIENVEQYIYSIEDIYPYRGSLWHLYKSMKASGVDISIDGHGGDETLAGYHHYLLFSMLDAACDTTRFQRISKLRKLYKDLYADPAKGTLHNFRRQIETFKPATRFDFSHGLLRNKPSAAYFPGYAEDKSLLERQSHLKQSLYFDFHYTLLPTILRNFDRVSMAHGLEIRAPFLDYRIVMFSMNLPDKLKIGESFTKDILRRIMQPTLPREICYRKDKIGFLSPFQTWLGKGFGKLMLDQSRSSSFLQSEIWHGPRIAKLIEEHVREQRWSQSARFWPFIQADMLLTRFRKKKTEYQVS